MDARSISGRDKNRPLSYMDQKRFATVQAQLARSGIVVQHSTDAAGATIFIASMSAWHQVFTSLWLLEAWAIERGLLR